MREDEDQDLSSSEEDEQSFERRSELSESFLHQTRLYCKREVIFSLSLGLPFSAHGSKQVLS